MNRIVIAGVQSGSGKTTIATGIMAAFAASRSVQPYKAGPDYIDPSYHSYVTGRRSRNLDTWMVEEASVLELFCRGCEGADIAVVEGVMGLFDGRTGGGEAGSTAQIAKLLEAPVVLVIDAARIARSAAAIVRGFDSFDGDLRLAGVILNRVAGARHYEAVAPPIEQEAGIPVLGYLPSEDKLALPERYLGLVPTVEGSVAASYFEHLREACQRSIDLERLEQIAASAGPLPRPLRDSGTRDDRATLFPAACVVPRVRIAVARDRAFNFYYEDNLDLLRAWGAEIVEFSPLTDGALPAKTGGVYLGGGFPELFAADLAANGPMLRGLRAAAVAGMPIYAECGGLMYLGEQLIDQSGRHHEMAGVVPARSVMRGGRLAVGYREIRSLRDSPVLPAGATARAHEFHWSVGESEPGEGDAAYALDGDGRHEGFSRGSVLASYMHLHFAGSPAMAPRFVEAARTWRDGNQP